MATAHSHWSTRSWFGAANANLGYAFDSGLKRISETEFPVRVIDPVATMFEGLAPYQAAAGQAAVPNIREAVNDTDYLWD